MCGLVGIGGKLLSKDDDVIKRMLCFDYWRGKDSTGLAAVRSNGEEVHLAKLKSHPFDLFEMQKFKTACSGFSSIAFIGHNRAATKGVVTNHNAHPFEFGSVVGAHNGTLHYSSHSALEDAIGEKFEVDSQALICAIDRIGIEETIKLCQGAWALTWYDKSDKTLNFLRNSERPLWYAYSKAYDKVYWASEYWMIDASVDPKDELAVYTNDRGSYRFLGVEDNWHYKFDLNALKAGSTERPKPKVKEIRGKEANPVGVDPFGRDHFLNLPASGNPTHQSSKTSGNTSGSATSKGQGAGTGQNGGTGNKKLKKEPFIDPRVVHLIGTPENPYAGYMNENDFDYLARGGCAWCEEPVSFHDKGICIYEKDGTVLCSKCNSGDPNHIRIYTKSIKNYV